MFLCWKGPLRVAWLDKLFDQRTKIINVSRITSRVSKAAIRKWWNFPSWKKDKSYALGFHLPGTWTILRTKFKNDAVESDVTNKLKNTNTAEYATESRLMQNKTATLFSSSYCPTMSLRRQALPKTKLQEQ